jgi:benzoyl-CoA reductase/2-hydroxyglutaryl-CoA dehydratase subunit BcrC/BadD/HgdB
MKEILGTLTELKEQGKRLMGCFPLYPPVELLHSFGLSPVVLWGMSPGKSDFSRSDRHLQSYTCQVARCLTEFVLSDARTLFDGFFMYNACDTLRNLPEILDTGLREQGTSLPLFKLHIPMIPAGRTGAREYLKDRIHGLVRELESFTGRSFSPEDFRSSASLYRRQRELCTDLENHARQGTISFTSCAKILQLSHALPVEAHIKLLEQEIASLEDDPSGEPFTGVMISGIEIPPRPLIQAIESSGFRIVANDIAMLKRSYGYSPAPADDPGDYYQDFYFNHYPCTTLLPEGDRRVSLLRRTVRENKVSGFIFFGEKFCEYEYLEIPLLTDMLKSEGTAALSLELGADGSDDLGTLKNRIEAFAEMLKG